VNLAAKKEHSPSKRHLGAQRLGHGVAARVDSIAKLAGAALGGGACAIGCHAGGREYVSVIGPATSNWERIARRALAALDNRSAEPGIGSPRGLIKQIEFSAAEIEAIAGSDALRDGGIQAVAAAFTDTAGTVRAVLIAPSGRPRGECTAILQIAGRAVLAEISAEAEHAALRYWREHATGAIAATARAKRELDDVRSRAAEIDSAVSRAKKFRPTERMSRFGALVADSCGCEDWAVAVQEDGHLRIVASSMGLSAAQECFELRDELAECCREKRPALRLNDLSIGKRTQDKLFFGPCTCIPIDAGVVALGGRINPVRRAHAEELVRQLAPTVRGWVLEAERDRNRALVQRLALRMFNAVDEERGRIARDLHDDQAQLLAAARIALVGGRDEARATLERVERALRRKTRELRPAEIGRGGFEAAIAREIGRIDAAGIRGRMTGIESAGALPRLIQRACLQVVREALSNVIRHAHAKSVEIAIERGEESVRVAISDDGRGLRAAARGDGFGLAGMRERLELMGGRLTIESTHGGTAVVAEVPVPRK